MALSNTELQYKHRRTLKGTISNKLQSAKKNARKKSIEFNLTNEFLTNLWNDQGGLCALSGVEMGYIGSGWCTASIDRINPDKGYTEDNVQWTCWRVNDSKSNMKNEDFVNMCASITSKYYKQL